MGQAKEAILKREDDWLSKARSEGWNCGVCGSTPIYDEREIFFDTGKCGSCAHIAAKDD